MANDINSLARRDEEAYVKAMREREQQDQRKYEEQQRNTLKTKQMQMNGLNQQLMEKQAQKKMQTLENTKYGEEVKNQIMSQQ